MKILIYSFATTSYFFRELVQLLLKEGHECFVIILHGQYKDFYKNVLDSQNVLYLYENFDSEFKVYNDISFCFECDNIFKILSSDKDGYIHEDSLFQLNCAQTIYNLYKNFLLKKQPEIAIFPDVETIDGLILINLCKALKIEILYTVHMRMLGTSFFSCSNYETLPNYFGDYTNEDIKKARIFMSKFQAGELSAFEYYQSNNNPEDKNIPIHKPCLFYKIIKFCYIKLKYEKKYRGEDHLYQKMKVNLLPLLNVSRKLRYYIVSKKYFHINSLFDLPNKYVLFALQYSPESSINTMEQFFVDQIRVIDLLRFNVPDNYWIVVKEHPAMRGVRCAYFYKQLRKKPGVLLCDPTLKSKDLIKQASLVVTVTGTIGLESFLLDKPCLMFGSTFFSHLRSMFNSYNGLKTQIYDLIFNYKPYTYDEKLIEIAKLYNISGSFIIIDPIKFPFVMRQSNIYNTYHAILKHLRRLKNNYENSH